MQKFSSNCFLTFFNLVENYIIQLYRNSQVYGVLMKLTYTGHLNVSLLNFTKFHIMNMPRP